MRLCQYSRDLLSSTTDSMPCKCSRCDSISPAGPAPMIPICVRIVEMKATCRALRKKIATIPTDLADVGRSSAAPLQNRSQPIAGASFVLDVTIALRSQLRLQTEHGKCLHL